MKDITRIFPSLIICFTSLFILSACHGGQVERSFNQLDHLKPLNYVFNHMPEGADGFYNEGWKNGCESGLSTFSNDFYKAFYQYQVRSDLMHHVAYSRAWETAYHYCRGYGYGMVKEAGMRMNRPHSRNQIRLTGLDQWINGWGPQFFSNWWVEDDEH